ncbi:Clavaminate synthase-like protein [Venustampulla echinocandica]|uniref:Clavaminate synthase-like protein n=1 Tax=Venustampulla echinocandica TaxID=2656787 RepID=A0A370TWE3_9HELO|nr:Clavaminate synthase-like protein [Venustampulla echinocandica]RDL39798.1 Clavaminate synthase-like protein [Venustampulla echinocandica]
MAAQSEKNGIGQIPIIDIDISGAAQESEVAEKLVDAAARYGFVYVRNQGKDIPIEAIENMFDLSRTFFSSPADEKASCKITENNRGWSGMHTETLDAKNQRVGDFKEAMNFGEFVEGKAQQPLPPCFRANESNLNQFQKYCHTMMLKLLKLFAIGLKIDEEAGGSDWFASRHRGGGPSGCTLRLLHYPQISSGSDYQPSVDIRAGAHSDYGSITLLFQRPGQPGLEIIPPETRTAEKNYGPTAAWTPVPVNPPGTENDPSPPILVNIGDLLSHWTNNLLKSTVHRVVFPKGGKDGGEDRYSIAYFGHPISSTILEPVPSEMVRVLALGGENVNGSGVKAMTADEHLMSRLKATYLGMYKDDEGDKEAEKVSTS